MGALIITAMLIAGGVSIIALIKHRLRAGRPVVVGMIAGGWGLAGNGWAGDMLARGSEALATWVSEATSSAVGASVPGLALAIVAGVIAIDMKDRAIMRITPWLGLVLPTMAAVVGGMYAGTGGALGTIGDWLLWLVQLPTMLG